MLQELLLLSLMSFDFSFDQVFDVERHVVQSSFESGVSIGRERGDSDGFQLGFKHGFALACELAQYAAFVAAVRHELVVRDLSAKAVGAVDALAERLREFRAATSNEALQSQVDAIRGLYRKAASLCKIGNSAAASAASSL
jgi:hypothetical protein